MVSLPPTPPSTSLKIVHYLGYLLPFLNIGIIMANHDKVYGQPYRNKKRAGKEDKGIKDYIRSQLYQGGEQGEEQEGDGDEEVRAHPDLTGESPKQS